MVLLFFLFIIIIISSVNIKPTRHHFGFSLAWDWQNTVRVGIRTLRNWVKDFEVEEYIIDSMRGKHSITATPILDNLDFREEFKSHVRQTSREQGTVN